MNEKNFEPWNFLLVNTAQAGTDLIEETGYARKYAHDGQPIPESVLADMEKAARIALSSIVSYRKAVANGGHKRTLTREEYRALT